LFFEETPIMTSIHRPWAALGAGLMLVLVVATNAASAQQKTTRVAVVDPSRVFSEMQETKDLRVSLEAERQRLAATSKEKETEISNLQAQRKATRQDSPQFEDLNKQIMQKAMEYEVWGKFAKMEAERNQKKQMRSLFAKIEIATTEVAKQQQIDLVITDQSPELPDTLEGISIEQLRAVLNSRRVLYASDAANISTAVIAALDAKYKAGGGGPAAAPAPAPAAPTGKK
jgi:Skp family chaperone for outer membrane proteins